MENWHADVRVQRVNSASKIVNSVGEKERKFLKHSKFLFTISSRRVMRILKKISIRG